MLGCASESPTQTQTSAIVQLTPEQVISIVHVYGVPYIPAYSKDTYSSPFEPSPVGQWAANYEGNDTWRIQGSIVLRRYGRDYYGSTTWLFIDNRLELVNFEGEAQRIAVIHSPSSGWENPFRK